MTLNQKKTQRVESLIFSDQNELDRENVKEKSSAKKEIVYPYETKNFITTWEGWKEYKKENFGFEFNEMTEQTGLKILITRFLKIY